MEEGTVVVTKNRQGQILAVTRQDEDGKILKIISKSEPLGGYKINTDSRVAVATDYFWQEMNSCPKEVTVQLLNEGGTATYGIWDGKDPQWQGWAPAPRRKLTHGMKGTVLKSCPDRDTCKCVIDECMKEGYYDASLDAVRARRKDELRAGFDSGG